MHPWECCWTGLNGYCIRDGITLYLVNPAYTSQSCYKCGHTTKDNRHASRFKCTMCGQKSHADANAPVVIYYRKIRGTTNGFPAVGQIVVKQEDGTVIDNNCWKTEPKEHQCLVCKHWYKEHEGKLKQCDRCLGYACDKHKMIYINKSKLCKGCYDIVKSI